MSNVIIDAKNNADEVIADMNRKIERGLTKCAMQAVRYAKQDCPVDTGNLRNSISYQVRGNAAYIGTSVEYAPYVEFGTGTMTERPYLRPAAANHSNEYKKIIRDEMKG